MIHFYTTKRAISKQPTSDKQKGRLLIAQGAEAISSKVSSDKRVRCERYPHHLHLIRKVSQMSHVAL